MNKTKVVKNENYKPLGIAWFIYSFCTQILMLFKHGYYCDRRVFRKRNKKEGCLVLYNHTSNHDHFATTAAFGLKPVNYVITKYFYFNRKLAKVLNQVKAIPRDQFTPDLTSIKIMKRALEKGRIIPIAPTGQISVHGAPIYVDKAISKLLKLCKADVYTLQIFGNYLACPKWGLSKRRTRVHSRFVKTLTKEEIATMTDEEIYERVCQDINVNDIHNQEILPQKIHGKALAEGIENILYVCPKCGSKFKIISNKNNFVCQECGNTVHINQYCLFEPVGKDCTMFQNEEEWYHWETALLTKQIENNTLNLTGEFKILLNLDDPWVIEEVGTGHMCLTKDRFFIDGTVKGKEIHKEFSLDKVVQLPWRPNSHFEITGEPEGKWKFIAIPDSNRVVEWVQAIDAIRMYRHK